MRLTILEILIFLATVLTIQNVQAEEIRLIVRGDDLGMSQGSIVAFEKAFREGKLTCASIQVPAPWMEAAADLARKHPQQLTRSQFQEKQVKGACLGYIQLRYSH